MTVGELVQAEMALDLVRGTVAGGGEVRSYLSILCHLGIWDAEVLEKRVEEDDFGDYALSHLTQAEGRKLGLKFGQRVRLIVLPCKEEK